MSFHDPIALLIHQLSRLPGVGRKSATRLAYFILRQNDGYAERLAETLTAAQNEVCLCAVCGNLTPQDPCVICRDTTRNPGLLCVVEQVPDLMAVEATGEFKGIYHVLQGVISPLNGVGPEDLRLAELMERARGTGIHEIIVATNPTVDGEATALYIKRLLAEEPVRVTRLASGMPVGSDLEYLDPATITRALTGRREIA